MDIVERLRKRKAYNAEYDFHGNEIIGDDPDEDCQEAADEIERLRKDSRLYWDAFQKSANEIEQLRKYQKLVYFIAHDYIELSQDKTHLQRDDWYKRCNKLIKVNDV